MMRMMRKVFDDNRRSYWSKMNDSNPEPSSVTLALLADIHTMLEYLTVEPYEEEMNDAKPKRNSNHARENDVSPTKHK